LDLDHGYAMNLVWLGFGFWISYETNSNIIFGFDFGFGCELL